MTETIGSRLRRVRKKANLTQAELAARVGLTQSGIGNIEAGTRGYGASVVEIAKVLDTTPEYLQLAVDAPEMASNVALFDRQPGEIPLISWIRAGEFCESPDNFAPGDAEEYLPRPLANMGPNTFALKVIGDSMDVPGGYREGEIVYVDPDQDPQPGKDVVARAASGMTLKRYKVDEEGPYLLQLNGNKIIRPPLGWTVCGVVVFSGVKR